MTSQVKFIEACRNGNLELVQKLYSEYNIDVHAGNEGAFRWACYNGHLKVAQWLLSLNLDQPIDVHNTNEWVFRNVCEIGNLNMAQWLVSLDLDPPIDIHAVGNWAFKGACWKGHLEIAQWLVQLGADFYDIPDCSSEVIKGLTLEIIKNPFFLHKINNLKLQNELRILIHQCICQSLDNLLYPDLIHPIRLLA